MSYINKDRFNYFFPVGITFISFTCLIALARISTTTLNRSGVSEWTFIFFFLIIGGKNSVFTCELRVFEDRDHLCSEVCIEPQMYIFAHF